MRSVRVLVSGTVQGVGYREACRRAAASAGVHGWVENRDDGRVEALFAGPDPDVETMVQWCRSGPDGTAVLAVDVERFDTTPDDLADRFEVR